MQNFQNEDWYDDSEQGRQAIRIGLEHTPESWVNYDWTQSAGADFDWPDIDAADIGSFEPWLCLQKQTDGRLLGWQDLNAIPDGGERRLEAAARSLGLPESCSDDYDVTMQVIEAIRDADDFDAAARARGFSCSAHFTYRDHVDAVEARWEEERRKSWDATQELLNESTAQLNTQMNASIDAARVGGLLDPVHGVTLEDWAAANAKIIGGASVDEILAVLQLEKPHWDEINAEWNGRMSRDTTLAIVKVYGEAFQNPHIGRFGGGAAQPRTGAPCSFEDWIKVGVHMSKGAEQGMDPQAVLASHGMSVLDWSAAGAYWSVEFNANAGKYFDQHTRLHAKYEKEYAGATIGDDIAF